MSTAFPPQRSQDSVPIPVETALTYLQTYINATKTSPYLLPNARLELSGPSAGPAESSVTMHNLQRVEAGLRGEWLAPVLDLGEAVPVATGVAETMGEQVDADKMETEGWQDLDEYQRQQEDIEGEIVPKATGADIGVENAEAAEAPKVKNSKDKEARKAEKKARQKEEQRKKGEEARRAAAERQA
ncbi:hypothetical protein PVAG01_01817 [Phlyctema vagabunda]|uniref:Uncharacterized protein n=1 Tax=Phlyctema vagabunda TaxID=108571 RepID=A0ABR4PY65_9HELO